MESCWSLEYSSLRTSCPLDNEDEGASIITLLKFIKGLLENSALSMLILSEKCDSPINVLGKKDRRNRSKSRSPLGTCIPKDKVKFYSPKPE